ncbi:MAG: hypothetical protein IT287_02465 [Bdellovibrionaceae bacterium]|nr:hypothetical protein [Pseudobdellovibrionaceae bacterium]
MEKSGAFFFVRKALNTESNLDDNIKVLSSHNRAAKERAFQGNSKALNVPWNIKKIAVIALRADNVCVGKNDGNQYIVDVHNFIYNSRGGDA